MLRALLRSATRFMQDFLRRATVTAILLNYSKLHHLMGYTNGITKTVLANI